MSKLCSKCKLPNKKFYKNKTTKDGLAAWCKDCCKERSGLYYKKNKNKICSKTQRYYKKNGKFYSEYRAFYIKDKIRNRSPERRYQACKKRATKDGLEFKLSFEEFLDITQKPCHYCGGFSGKMDFCGIDRMMNSLGYLKENCTACCKKCNYAKHISDIQEFKEHIVKIYNYWIKANQ